MSSLKAGEPAGIKSTASKSSDSRACSAVTRCTADTLHALRDFYPPQVKLYFITGADAIIDIVTWHDAERIAELATFIAATRPGFDIDTARARIKESGLPFDVRYIQIPALAISSTNIRKRVARGMSVRYLTSESVLGYIRKRRLYADLGQEDFE